MPSYWPAPWAISAPGAPITLRGGWLLAKRTGRPGDSFLTHPKVV